MYPKKFAALFVIGLGLSTFGCTSNPSSPEPVVAPTVAPVATATPAPVSQYEKKLVRRPGKGVEDGKVYVVQNGKKRWVVNASWFAANGYKFPAEVNEISAAELDAIPTGEPIQ